MTSYLDISNKRLILCTFIQEYRSQMSYPSKSRIKIELAAQLYGNTNRDSNPAGASQSAASSVLYSGIFEIRLFTCTRILYCRANRSDACHN